MTRRTLAALVACTIASAGGMRASAEDKPADPSSIEFRSRFIRDFKHTIMDTSADDAMFLRICVDATGAKRGIEVGTYKAFGAMNMGIAFERVGGHLYTVEINPTMAAISRANLKTVALDKSVTVIEGDALKVLPKLEGKYDFIFIDAVKRDYFRYLKDVEDKLLPGSLITADNTIGSARAMRDFLAYLDGKGYDAVTIRASMAKNDGVTLAYKIPNEKLSPGLMDTADRDKLIRELALAKADGTVIDARLLRIFAEAARAKHGVAVGAGNGYAVLNMGIAFERTGGRLEAIAAKADAVRANVRAARLDKTVSVTAGEAPKALADVKGRIDFLFIDGAPEDYLKYLEAVEGRLTAGAVIIADNTLLPGKHVKGFIDYLRKSPNYNTVTLRNKDRSNKDGMTVAYKIR